jgi:hypothetical protein
MATKKNTPPASKKVAKPVTKTPEAVVTPVRNTTVPPKSVVAAAPATKKSPPSYQDIAIRAYLIWEKTGGGEFDNWIRAERELSSI